MHHGSIGTICTDGIETQIQKSRLFLSALLQIIRRTDLCHWFAADIGLEIMNKLSHGKTIINMGLDRVCNLCLILDGAHQF